MKRLVNWMIVLSLVGSLASCGLPGAAVRTVSNTAKSVGTMLKSTASSVTKIR